MCCVNACDAANGTSGFKYDSGGDGAEMSQTFALLEGSATSPSSPPAIPNDANNSGSGGASRAASTRDSQADVHDVLRDSLSQDFLSQREDTTADENGDESDNGADNGDDNDNDDNGADNGAPMFLVFSAFCFGARICCDTDSTFFYFLSNLKLTYLLPAASARCCAGWCGTVVPEAELFPRYESRHEGRAFVIARDAKHECWCLVDCSVRGPITLATYPPAYRRQHMAFSNTTRVVSFAIDKQDECSSVEPTQRLFLTSASCWCPIGVCGQAVAWSPTRLDDERGCWWADEPIGASGLLPHGLTTWHAAPPITPRRADQVRARMHPCAHSLCRT
eukprot:COSAG05_NODE_525_length_8961_cov_212.374591_10_plen_335_part_00